MSRFKLRLKDGTEKLLDDVKGEGNLVKGILRDSHRLILVPTENVEVIEEHYVGNPGLSFPENNYNDGDSRKYPEDA